MREYGDKGRWVKYWAQLGCWISPCYGLFSLGARFETYEQFVSLFSFFFFRDAVNCGYRISGYGEYDCTGFIFKHFRSTTCKSLWLLTLYTLNNLNFTSDRILGRTTDTNRLRIQTANKENATWSQNTFLNYTPDGHKNSSSKSLSFTSAGKVKFVCWIVGLVGPKFGRIVAIKNKFPEWAILMVLIINMFTLWDVTPCILVRNTIVF
jgi:hypothetical protein